MVTVNLDPIHYQSEDKSKLFKMILSVFDTFAEIGQEIGTYSFSNMILDDQRVVSIIEENIYDEKVDLWYL